MKAVVTISLVAAAVGVGTDGGPRPALAEAPGCPGATSADGIARLAGAPLRFGITPGVQTGQLGTGPAPPRTPEDPVRQTAALARLAPPGTPFVLRLHRFFWSDGEAGVQRFLELARRYTSQGMLVELQLRYHPNASQEGDIGAWVAFVRDIVDRFGPIPGVVAIQVTNEVNLAISPDSSDGAFRGGRDALVQGVIAAKDEARLHRFGGLAVGFNWAYRASPQDDESFWAYLRDSGGERFRSALDWVGLDAYPGSFFPPVEAPGRERDGMVNALSSLRCFAGSAGINGGVPIHVEENGFPTAPTPDRSYARQAQALESLVNAVNDFRGTYNVSDYRWFDLRDADTTSPSFQQQYGLMTDTYVEKPAFDLYRRLIAALGVRAAPAPGPSSPVPTKARRGLVARLSCTREGRLRARVSGPAVGRVVSARVTLGRRILFRTSRAPLDVRLADPRRRGTRLALVVRLRGGELLIAPGPSHRCSGVSPRPLFTA
ncbi:MAG: hypothetical protein NVSMB25_21310 [Thermoleophilaceae bacterium]